GNVPVKILFLGPNGTGKTTTIAKLTNSFKNSGVSVVMSASDTFRAAAIEQMAIHAGRLGVPIIKSTYGADPASVAFDAIAYGRAHGINVVMIDSAGRQETNKNLISEVQKMVRIAKPDLTIYVGESTAGNAISEQIKEFGRFMKIDGIILTKLDCDAKGGNALSIAQVTGIPVLFFGTGEGYDALVPYSPEFVVDAVMPSN
ncbi:MAG: signal recognition particle-docking protein FtsY, partial [Candidatus Micrarchaeaceae archaeon]